MSFDGRETSLAAGAPIRLYEFSRGVLRWLYNSSDRDIAVSTQVFRTLRGGISDNGIRQSGVSKQDAFVITAPADIEVTQPWRGGRPSAEVYLRVFDTHYGESEAVTRFVGTISSVKWPRLDTCTITCQDIESSMERPGLIDTHSRTCTTTLYSTQCGVDRNLYRAETTIQSIAGLAVSSGEFASYPDGWFSGGYVEWPIGSGEYDSRHIETHAGSVLQLLGGTAGLAAGQAIRVYPGCDFLAATCDGKFDNLINLRATPHMDGKSPFDGEQVF
ncbi:phage BR0599 family protein [Pseudomonas aeruginosa]|uniref:phage BR0599 family protein n=1 Tax=Pseudomonas aeruginosa TaxID=287 RepID=UPI00053CFD42|nr:phage BR0599 family protein [Pseudomonas aeruginosa]